MISPDDLRAAATRLRTLAEAATTGTGPSLSGTWFVEKSWPQGFVDVIAKDEGSVIAENICREQAEFITALSPDAALALADLMDGVAEDHHPEPRWPGSCHRCDEGWPCPEVERFGPLIGKLT